MDQPESSAAAVAERFYSAFARRDGDTMAACYAERCDFSDPVFTDIQDHEVGAMWRMLTRRAKDFSVTYKIVGSTAHTAEVEWIADYLFSATGRKVQNHVRSTLQLEGGRIVHHRDVFDLHRWASQALGLKGTLLGWLPPVQQSIRKQARRGLADFLAKEFAAKP